MNIQKIPTESEDINSIAKNILSKCERISSYFNKKLENSEKCGVDGLKKFKEFIYNKVLIPYYSKIGFSDEKFDLNLYSELRNHVQFYDTLLEISKNDDLHSKEGEDKKWY